MWLCCKIYFRFYIINFLLCCSATQKSRYFDIKNNYAFRKVFSSKKLVIHLLNNILGYDGANEIREVIKYLGPVPEYTFPERYSEVDVLCENMKGIQQIIQMSPTHRYFTKFIPYIESYAVNAYIKQMKHLEQVIYLVFADCIMFPDELRYKSNKIVFDHDELIPKNNNNFEKFYFTFIELPKFNKSEIKQLENDEERWLYIFKYPDRITEENLDSMTSVDDIFEDVYESLNSSKWLRDEKISYVIASEEKIKIMREFYDSSKEEKMYKKIM